MLRITRLFRGFRRTPATTRRRRTIPSDPPAFIDDISGAILRPVTRVQDPVFDPESKTTHPGRFDGGVYDLEGNLLRESENKYLNHDNDPPERVDPGQALRLHGRHLYAGLVQNLHFGHFLTENTSRLWGLDHTLPVDGIIYLGRYPRQPLAPYIKDLFEIFAPGLPLIAVQQPTQVDTLVMPQALRFPLGALSGHPLNRAFFANRIAALPDTRSDLPERVFVSRSRLARAGARFVLEEAIDENFRDQGYTVIHPQDLPVAEQLRIYSNARTLVFSEGSAIHLYVLAAKPGQKVFFIWRRKVMHPIFDRQLQSFGAGPLQGSNHVLAPLPSLKFPNVPARAASLVDFASLGRDLADLGYIDGKRWQIPSTDRQLNALGKLGDVFDTAAARDALAGKGRSVGC